MQRALATCGNRADVVGPVLRVEPNRQGNWSIITWRFVATFHSGERLTAFESHEWRGREHYRKISYRLMQPDGVLIFQVDPHQRAVPYSRMPHLHKGPTEECRLHEGDWELGDYSLRDFDFLRMWDLVCRYLEKGELPWRT